MKKFFAVVLVLALFISACGGESGASQDATAQPTVVFVDEDFELLYQAALSNNPQWTGTDVQKRQTFFFQYGGGEAQEVYAAAYAREKGNVAFVQAASVMALKNPPAWLYAAAAALAANTIIAMNAQEAANLELPTIPVEQLSQNAKMILLLAEAMLVTQYTVGAMQDQALWVADDLTPATKVVEGSYAYWEAMPDGGCFFGVNTPFSWAANILPDGCPESPDDEEAIAKLIEKLWNSFETGYTWKELAALGGKAAGHVAAIIEVAKAYGVTLVP